MSRLQLHQELSQAIMNCQACPRLREHCQKIAVSKRKSYQGEDYWGRPLPGFGDPKARLLVVGLAPAAHGANRTGRVFTGDRSGEWLYRALHKAGFANQPASTHLEDGLALIRAYVTCVARCAPPNNKPLPEELARCATFLKQEIQLLREVRVILALGQVAFHGVWKHLEPERLRPKFGHGIQTRLSDGRLLLTSYHPSQQNTFTGRLTEPMFDSVFHGAQIECRP